MAERLLNILTGKIPITEATKDLSVDKQVETATDLADDFAGLSKAEKATPAGRQMLADALAILNQATKQLNEKS